MKILILIFFEIKESKITRGHNFTLVKKQSRLDVRKFSCSQRSINVWNKLSAECVHASRPGAIPPSMIPTPIPSPAHLFDSDSDSDSSHLGYDSDSDSDSNTIFMNDSDSDSDSNSDSDSIPTPALLIF